MSNVCSTLSPELAAELDTLKSNPTFGNIAARAFDAWCSKRAQPRLGAPGTEVVGGVFVPQRSDPRCCLIGAAALGLSEHDGISAYDAISRRFGLVDSQINGLFSGFDRVSKLSDCDAESYDFGVSAVTLAEKIFGKVERYRARPML